MMKVSRQKGFTLVEIIVVMSVFLFIIGAAIGIFISIVQNQKKVLSEQQIINQVSYIEEYMSKALRMAAVSGDSDTYCIPSGYIYQLRRYDTSLGVYRGIRFLDQTGSNTPGVAMCQEFYLDGDGTSGNPYILKELKNISDNTTDADAVILTPTSLQLYASSNYQVTPIRFAINGSDGSLISGAQRSDSVQPRITILMNIKISGYNNTFSIKTVQTTVSQRNLKVK